MVTTIRKEGAEYLIVTRMTEDEFLSCYPLAQALPSANGNAEEQLTFSSLLPAASHWPALAPLTAALVSGEFGRPPPISGRAP